MGVEGVRKDTCLYIDNIIVDVALVCSSEGHGSPEEICFVKIRESFEIGSHIRVPPGEG